MPLIIASRQEIRFARIAGLEKSFHLVSCATNLKISPLTQGDPHEVRLFTSAKKIVMTFAAVIALLASSSATRGDITVGVGKLTPP